MEFSKADALCFFGADGPANDVLKHMEDVANQIFYENPEDINGYIIKYFEKLSSKPLLLKIHARFSITKSWPSFHINIHAKVHNNIKVLRSCAVSNFPINLDDIKDHFKNIEKSIVMINDTISPKLCNISFDNQIAVDDCLKEFLQFCKIEEQVKQYNSGRISVKSSSNNSLENNPSKTLKVVDNKELYSCLLSIASVSRALCVASSILTDVPLYEYISDSFDVNSDCHFSMPVPLITACINSRMENSKLNPIKEFLLIPAPHITPNELMLALVKISSGFQQTSEGSDDVIEMLTNAVSQSGYSFGEDFFLGINCAANEIYQEDKESYETTPEVYKSGKELRMTWLELISKHPSIICLIDPFHQKDKDEWTKLCGQISSKCFVIASYLNYPRECVNHKNSFHSSGILITFNDLATVSDMWLNSFKNKEKNFLILSTCEGETCDTFPLDMAVALRAAFVKVGLVSTTETSAVLNRMSQIYEELMFLERMNQPCTHHTFHQVGEIYEEDEMLHYESKESELTQKPSKVKRSRAKK